MTLRVHIAPTPQQIADDNGIGRIVHAQYRLLPSYGIELVGPAEADVIACHIEKGGLSRVDVLHVHGLYFSDIPHAPYARWHHTANHRIAAAAREARAITVPSPWVAEPFKRDMRLTPHVIGHGIDLADWTPAQPGGYALWNKNRGDSDVCVTAPAVALARAGIPVVSTFGPADVPLLRVVGIQPHATMRDLVRHATAYIATTPETFGIGTLEAMAAGVPIIGYDWCGTADLVRNGVDGVLVAPGDEAGLIEAWHYVLANRAQFSRNARERAQAYTWDAAMDAYAALFHQVAEERQRRERVAVVVTSYNYGRYLGGCLDSLFLQHAMPDEVIVVDDGSTDDTTEAAQAYADETGRMPIQVLTQENQGVAAARNNGIAATDCELIVCLDADDELGPEYLKVCADALRADRGLGIAYTGLGFLQENGDVSATTFPPPFDWAKQTEPTTPPATTIPTAAMFRRSLWERAGGYQQMHAPGEDAEFYTRGLSIGYGARKVSDDPLIHYRAHAGSASRSRPYKRVDVWHPWMRDGQYPFAAPAKSPVPVRSYARPAVSVIIPVGPGHARYLPAALDSLLGQSFRQWEAIVVIDDPDIDPTSNDFGRLMRPYPFVTLYHIAVPQDRKSPAQVMAEAVLGTRNAPGSQGPSAARNAALFTMLRAPLCLFLDADDWLLPGALEVMVRHYAESGGKYVYGDALAYGEGEPRRLIAPPYRQDGWWKDAPDGTPLMHHSVTALVPTEAARAVGFDEAITGWEEQFFFADLAARGVCGVRVDAPLIGYRVASGTVRRASFAQASELRALRHDRYARYIAGEAPMACCGGGGISAVQQALDEVHWSGEAVPEGMTLVRYTGQQAGAVTLTMARGVPLRGRYRYAAAPDMQIFPVFNEDIEAVLSSGPFTVYEYPVMPIPTSEEIIAAEPTVATVEATVVEDAPVKGRRGRRT